jgi:uncharacterized membrane protein (UPF0127 family)
MSSAPSFSTRLARQFLHAMEQSEITQHPWSRKRSGFGGAKFQQANPDHEIIRFSPPQILVSRAGVPFAGTLEVLDKDIDRVKAHFTVAVARKGPEIQMGLGFVDMPQDHAMYFKLTSTKHQEFWMKNCVVPLDMLFLGSANEIVDMVTLKPSPLDAPDAALKKYLSSKPGNAVVELLGGTAHAHGIQISDRVYLGRSDLS